MNELRTEPRQRRSQQSIEAILDAAERLIHHDGQVSFTANELATAADMSIGRVYYWFPDIPSVVNALAERAVGRIVDLFQSVLAEQQHCSTPLLVQRTVDGLCGYVEANPAAVALCLTGGDSSYGAQIQQRMYQTCSDMIRTRVPGVPDSEVDIVARTIVGITLGMLRDYARAGDLRPMVRKELVYVLSSWLYARYPGNDDPVWDNPAHQIQPSRRPLQADYSETLPVYPALSPLEV